MTAEHWDAGGSGKWIQREGAPASPSTFVPEQLCAERTLAFDPGKFGPLIPDDKPMSGAPK